MKLSILIPVYNERTVLETSIAQVLRAPLPEHMERELIMVDDCSTDGTWEILQRLDRQHEEIRLFRHEKNQGKGAAIRSALSHAEGEFTIVQDADLEYDPADYPIVLGPLLDGRADVVYGSRFKGGSANRVLYFWHSAGNRVLTTASNMMTNLNLTDMETCFKAFRREVLQSFTIEENRFGVEPEITAKIAQLGAVVYEVGITYDGRTYADGKKIGWKDGVQAFFCILAYSPLGQRVRMNRLSPALSRAIGRTS